MTWCNRDHARFMVTRRSERPRGSARCCRAVTESGHLPERGNSVVEGIAAIASTYF